MIHIELRSDALQPMLDWLKRSKETGIRDEEALRSILQMEDYRIEFARYGMEGAADLRYFL